jgi:hypothetical protein
MHETEDARDVLMLGMFTGMRRSEIITLQWEMVDLVGKVLYLPTTKNGDPLELPLSDFLIELLDQRRNRTGQSPWVFPSRSKTGHITETKTFHQRVSAASGVRFTMHDLLARDISEGPNPRRIIMTDALFAQVLDGLDPMERYVHQILDEGRLSQSGVNGHRTATIKAMWRELQDTQPKGKWVTPVKLGRFISKHFHKVVVKAQNGIFRVRRVGDGYDEERSTLYTFYALPECRKCFEKLIGQSVPWSNDLDDWQ